MDKPPASLRPIQPYLMVYKQFLKRDPVMSYYGMLGDGDRPSMQLLFFN